MKPALIIVDVQEDFLPPNGSLAVKDGRDVVPVINRLLNKQWTLKVATKDWHPQNHCSFAVNNTGAKNYDTLTFKHPEDPSIEKQLTVWPKHCVQNTNGSESAKELHHDKVDLDVKKGYLQDREYYSAFADVWSVHKTELERTLKNHEITHVFVVGIALDFCVFYTALDSAALGWPTFVVSEGCKPIYPEKINETIEQLEKGGVKVVGMDSKELSLVK